jgi:UDP-N-acetylglucosamine acyltransferase
MKQDLYNSDWINIDGNSIHKTAIIHPNVVMGKGNVIGAYCVIGGNGEIRDKDQMDFKGTVHIGNHNVISEFVSIQRPFDENKSTIICDDNIIMAHTHIGHDTYIGSKCEICTGTVVGGYVTIYDDAKIKLNCTIRNRVIIGMSSVVGMGSVVVRNVPNFGVVYGNPAKEKKEPENEIEIEPLNTWYLFALFSFICSLISTIYSFYHYSSLVDACILISITTFWFSLFMGNRIENRKTKSGLPKFENPPKPPKQKQS